MIKAYFDGLCEPVNPGGVATYGYVIYRDDVKIASGYGVIGAGMFGDETSNNIAEYYALIKLLEKVIELGIREAVEIYGDSQLIINQVNGVYRVRSKKLKPLYEKTLELLSMLRNARISWIPREMNKEADKLSYKAYIEFMYRYGKEAVEYYKQYLVTKNQANMLKRLGIDANPYIPRRLFWRIYMQHKLQK